MRSVQRLSKFQVRSHSASKSTPLYFSQTPPFKYTPTRFFHATGITRKSPWEVLEITETSDEQEIKKAYIAMSRKYHPDICKDADATDKFTEVVKAYNILKDPKKRTQAKLLDFEDFDYRGNSDAPTKVDLTDFFQTRDEIGVNNIEVARRVFKDRKKKDKKDQEKEIKDKIMEFLRKPKLTIQNVKKEYPERSIVKEGGSEYINNTTNSIELLNLTEDKLFVLGYLMSNTRGILNQSIYTWQNRIGLNLAEGVMEDRSNSKSNSFLSMKKMVLKMKIDADEIGSIETNYFPIFPFISNMKFFDSSEKLFAKMNRIHFFGTRFSFTQLNNDNNANENTKINGGKCSVSRGIRPFVFKEYSLLFRDRSIHPSFIGFATLIAYQLDVSSFSIFKHAKKIVFGLLKKIKGAADAAAKEEEEKEEKEKEKEKEKKEPNKPKEESQKTDNANNNKQSKTDPYGYSSKVQAKTKRRPN